MRAQQFGKLAGVIYAAALWSQNAPEALGHDVIGLLHPSASTGQLTSNAVAQTLFTDPEVRSVLVNSAKWAPGMAVKVCFYGGDADVRQRIIAAGQRWIDARRANLRLDTGLVPNIRTCDGADTEHVRIGFRDRGYWSYIGLQGLQVRGPTMNLQDFDVADRRPNDREFMRIALHEWGHALGFHHEHQSPSVDCGWNWATLQELGYLPRELEVNFRQLERNQRMYTYSAYDSRSIMMYALDRRYFSNAACAIPENDDLSDQDERAMVAAYPRDQRIIESQRSSLASVTGVNLPPQLKDLLDLRKKLLDETR